MAALVGLILTGRTYLLSRRGQLTDRYTKAVTQLAADKLTERLGGIYALEDSIGSAYRPLAGRHDRPTRWARCFFNIWPTERAGSRSALS
jgi:hypothetical protein